LLTQRSTIHPHERSNFAAGGKSFERMNGKDDLIPLGNGAIGVAEPEELGRHDAACSNRRAAGHARPFAFAKALTIEFATELVEAILVIFLLAQTTIASFAGRVGFVLVAGILAAIATNVSYWNWYGFPCLYIASYMFTQIIGFLCIGIVAAFVLPKRSPRVRT